MFFFEILLDKGFSNENIIGLIFRYHLITFCLIFFSVYLSLQSQPCVLAALLYVKLYFNITNPQAAKSSLTELFKQAQKDAKKGLTNSRHTINELKERYQAKSTSKKENKSDEQS